MKKILLGLLFPIYSIGQTPKEVFQELIKQEVKYPKIVLAQSILETGDYSCSTCSMDANNLFGLRNVKENK